jgi:uncharacterized membrane protein YbhN (UPF0104 family)
VAKGMALWRVRPTTALVAVAAVVLAVALWRADPRAAAGAMADLPPGHAAGVVGMVLLAYALRFGKWHLFLRRLGTGVRPGRSLAVFAAGLLMVVTPAKVGEVWKALALREADGVPMPRGLAAVAMERLTDLIAVVSLALLVVATWANGAVLAAAAVAAFAAGLAVLRWRTLWLGLLDRLDARRPGGKAAGFLRAVYQDTHGLLAPAPLTAGAALGLVAWLLEGLALAVLLDGLGVAADPLWAAGVFALGTLAGVLSVLPGGLGTAEAGMVGLLVAGGVPAATALAATVLVRLLTLGLGALLGGAAYLAWVRRTRPAVPIDRAA